jgi:hypothetical protein
MRCILLGLFPWELQLPWAPITLMYDAGARLERVDCDCELACARGVIVSIRRRVGTSVTVTTRTVRGKFAVGRRPGVRPSTARMPRPGDGMPRRRGSAVNEPRSRPKPLKTWILRPRVVTQHVQQKNFFSPPLCNRPGCHEAPVTSTRNPARYCCPACRQAVHNVLDRERKWLARGTRGGRNRRAIEYQAARNRRLARRSSTAQGPRPHAARE